MEDYFKDNPYFKSAEFDSTDDLGSGKKMNKDFIDKLTIARRLALLPFIIISGFRTIEHNKKVKGVQNSSHLKGLACDIKYKNSRECYVIIKALIDAGFTRIGIGKSFIHVDDDKSKPQKVIFNYYD